MGKYERKAPAKVKRKKNSIYVVLLAVVVLILAVVAIGLGEMRGDLPAEQNPVSTEGNSQTDSATEVTLPARKELTIDSLEQQGDMMVLKTSYGTMKYPFAFSDLVEVEAVNREMQASLEWFALIGEEEYPIFTLTFNGNDGEMIGTMVIDADKPAEQVCMLFFTADEKLEEAELQTFYAVQEIINDVIASLPDNEEYTVAD